MVKVLISEDNLMLADFLEETLIDAGYTVYCRLCGRSRQARQCAPARSGHPGHASADGELGTDIAPLLTAGDRVGIFYASGSDTADLTVAQGDVCIRKPYAIHELLEALQLVQQIVAGTPTSMPVPSGVRVLR